MIVLLATALGGALLLSFLTAAVHRWYQVGFALIGVSVVFLNDIPRWPSASLGGISVGVVDLFAVSFLLSGIHTFTRTRPSRAMPQPPTLPPWARLLILVIVGAVAFGVLRGAGANGLGQSINEARGWIYVIATMTWIVSLKPSTAGFRRTLEIWCVWLAVSLTVVALSTIASNGLGSTMSGAIDEMGNEAGRPINAGQSLMLAMSGIILLSAGMRLGKRVYAVLALLSFTIVLIAQHRSVWAALAVALVAYILVAKWNERAKIVIVALGVGLALAVATYMGAFDEILEMLESSASDTRTYDGRVLGWLALIGAALNDGFFTILLGFPFGHGWERMQGSQYVRFSPHNWYVSVFLRLGLLGLVAFLTLLASGVLKSLKQRSNPAILAILVCAAVYMWPYSFDWYWSPFVVWALWHALSQPSVADTGLKEQSAHSLGERRRPSGRIDLL